jgi:hypothetical protein
MGEDFDAVHARLRAIMLAAAPAGAVVSDEPGYLVVRTAAIDPKTGEHGWFGTVTTKKSYVAYHLIPLYDRPALADDLSDALAKRRQGKTCFNFKKVDEGLFGELAGLTERAAG